MFDKTWSIIGSLHYAPLHRVELKPDLVIGTVTVGIQPFYLSQGHNLFWEKIYNITAIFRIHLYL